MKPILELKKKKRIYCYTLMRKQRNPDMPEKQEHEGLILRI